MPYNPAGVFRKGVCFALFLATLARAGEVRLQDLFDPSCPAFPLQAYSWDQWEGLSPEKKADARAIDPATWVTPPPDPEEKKSKAGKEGNGRKAEPPKDRVPGFRFAERLKAKEDAFNRLVGAGAAEVVSGIVHQLPLLDRERERFEKRTVAPATDEFLKVKAQVDKASEVQIKNYEKRFGKPPEQLRLSASLLQRFYETSLQLQHLVAIEESERQFDEFLERRLGALVAALSPDERKKPERALQEGLKAKDVRAMLRSARILAAAGDAASLAALDEALQREKDPLRAADLLRVRARAGGAGFFPALVHALDDERWPVRAAAIGALSRVRTKESVDALVARFAKEKGRLKDDIAGALGRLTGKDLSPEPEPWRVWWSKARAGFRFPDPAARKSPDAGGKGAAKLKSVYFYGIRTHSKRIVFCIDISGSMNWPLDGQGGKKEPRITKAKEELLKALHMLPAGARFDVVVYNATVTVWKRRMVDATPANKKSAEHFVQKLAPDGATNIYDALSTALDLACGRGGEPEGDTIYFLTDGIPTHGRVVDPFEILDTITARNKELGIVIHTIGVSRDQNAAFLLNLARRNGGEYVAYR